jgi:hypothetical protein
MSDAAFVRTENLKKAYWGNCSRSVHRHGNVGHAVQHEETIGALISTANWLTIIIVTPVVVGAYIYRIQREEAMLADKSSEQYEAYQAHKWKLIPFVY